MKKTILIYIFAGLLFMDTYGQVGVNTEKPTSDLDVNGNVLIMNNLLVGGDKNVPGSAGTDGQFLVSKGAGLAPEWQTVQVSTPVTGDWYLVSSISRTDMSGGFRYVRDDVTGAKAYDNPYTITQSVSATDGRWAMSGDKGKWDEFKDFTLELDKVDTKMRVVINVQFLAQAFWAPTLNDGESWMSYAVGVFRDVSAGASLRSAKMMGSRQGSATGTAKDGENSPQELMTFVMIIDIDANTKSKLYIMVTQRANSVFGPNYDKCYLALGHRMDTGVDDSILRSATMRADIYKLK